MVTAQRHDRKKNWELAFGPTSKKQKKMEGQESFETSKSTPVTHLLQQATPPNLSLTVLPTVDQIFKYMTFGVRSHLNHFRTWTENYQEGIQILNKYFKVLIMLDHKSKLKLLWASVSPQSEWLSQRKLISTNAPYVWERGILLHCVGSLN